MKVAVIGGGPTAFGALARLVALKQAGQALDIHVYTSGRADQENQIDAAYQARYSNQDINAILRAGKTAGSSGTLPPRSFHGQALQDHAGRGLETNIKISDTFGGIGNYWSSSVFPVHAFTDPIAAILGDLGAHYRFIAERIPVAGTTRGELDHFFEAGSINHPPIDVAAGLAKLQCRRDNADDSGMDLAIGINRFALNTRAEERNGCIQCGDCLYGCPRDAMFRAARPIAEFARNGQCRITFEKVSRVKSSNQQVRLTTRKGDSDYDKVFICAGALGTIELLGRSYGPPQNPVYLYDNLLWYFPAFSLWPRGTRLKDKVFAFAELAGGIFDHADQSYNHLLISTLPDAIMDNILSRNRLSRILTGLLSKHLIIGAMYGSHDEYMRYRIETSADSCQAESVDRTVDAMDPRKFALFSSHLARSGWYTSHRLAMENGTSGHYSANLGVAYGIQNLARSGIFDYNLHVCDSSSWNVASMSQQHTFTLMANASRIVQTAFP